MYAGDFSELSPSYWHDRDESSRFDDARRTRYGADEPEPQFGKSAASGILANAVLTLDYSRLPQRKGRLK